MSKVLVVIENDFSLDRADYVKDFMKEYTGEIIELTGFGNRSREEVFKAVSRCTDIAVQTCFVNGSDDQLHGMVKMLAKIPNPINVYIAYLGISNQNELFEYLKDNVEPKDLLSIAQHKIYAMSRDRYGNDKEPHLLLDFTPITKKLVKQLNDIQTYKDTARERPTGRKIRIIACNAFSNAFKDLPIGQIVDELICDKLVAKKSKHRGVWIWGNGEPVTLVNDCGLVEYEIVTPLSTNEKLTELSKLVDLSVKLEKLSPLEIEGLRNVIEDDEESPMSKANYICELLEIEKRGNRQNICKLLTEKLVETEK